MVTTVGDPASSIAAIKRAFAPPAVPHQPPPMRPAASPDGDDLAPTLADRVTALEASGHTHPDPDDDDSGDGDGDDGSDDGGDDDGD
jgi:hypothetical protein